MAKAERAYPPLLIVALGFSLSLAAIAVVEVLYLLQDLGASFSLVGSILGPAALAFLLFAPQARIIAERIGRGKYLLWSSLFLACSCIAASLLTNAGLYLGPKVLLSLLGPISVPIVLDSISEHFRFTRSRDGILFATTVLATIGASVGAWLSGVVASQMGLSAGYIVAAAGFFIAAGASFFVSSSPQPKYRQLAAVHPLAHVADIMTSRFALLGMVIFSVQLFWAIRDFSLPVLLINSGYSVLAVGVSFALASFGALVSLLLTRQMLSVNDARGVLVFAILIMATSSFVLAFGGLFLIMLCSFFFGIGSGSVSACIADIVTREAGNEGGESFMLALGTIGALAWLGGPILVGIFLEAGVSERVLLGAASVVLCYVFTAARSSWVRAGYLPRLNWRPQKKFEWL